MSKFAEYIHPVAHALFGEPTQRIGDQLRYRSRGSLAVEADGTWYDHESEQGGGVLDLIVRETSAGNYAEAARWLEDQGIKQADEQSQRQTSQRPRITATYDYVDEHGELLYQVCRMEPKNFRQRRPDGTGWSWKVKGVRQVPYRLPELVASQGTVVVVEGEKDADRLANELGVTATTNSGGSKRWPNSLAEHFKGRRVVILPDNDPAGREHAEKVAASLSPVAESVRVVELPGLPDKGDASDWIDAGGTREKLIQHCKAAPEWGPATEPAAAEPEPAAAAGTDWPFRCLGFDEGHYYYLPDRTQQVVAIPSGAHTNKSYLLTVAPLEWWEMAFPTKQGADWLAAANACMRASEAAGTFDPGQLRGRGAWYDEGRAVLHLGDRLLVDGAPLSLRQHRTRFVYERKPKLEALELVEPLGPDEASRLLEVTGSMNWSRDVESVLLAGWCVLAPICGAMSWRPHIWITGQRGTGKSWAVDNIISPAIGGAAMVVQSNSTEAGIRQKLKQDARPVMFDEAEGESRGNRARMQAVLELARQASSDSVAEIAKGTAGGKAMTFRIRSMFLMGSVNVGLSMAADKSRFTILSLQRAQHGEAGRKQFEELEALVNATLSPQWCAGLRSRTYELIPTIRANARVLAKVAAEVIGNQRAGDQIGTLLAGAYSLLSGEAITLDGARAWVASHDWAEPDEDAETSDEAALVSEIMLAKLRVDTQHGQKTRSVSELVQTALGKGVADYDVTRADADDTLARHGIKVRDADARVLFSDSHREIRGILADTPWMGGWSRILQRVAGAEIVKTARFAGVRHRAVALPFDEVVG